MGSFPVIPLGFQEGKIVPVEKQSTATILDRNLGDSEE
jgi:hypothetical protein